MKFLSLWRKKGSASQQGMAQWGHHEGILQLETGKGFPHHQPYALTHPYLPPESLKIVSSTHPGTHPPAYHRDELSISFSSLLQNPTSRSSPAHEGWAMPCDRWHRRVFSMCHLKPWVLPQDLLCSEPWLMPESHQGESRRDLCCGGCRFAAHLTQEESSSPFWDNAVQRGETGTYLPTSHGRPPPKLSDKSWKGSAVPAVSQLRTHSYSALQKWVPGDHCIPQGKGQSSFSYAKREDQESKLNVHLMGKFDLLRDPH